MEGEENKNAKTEGVQNQGCCTSSDFVKFEFTPKMFEEKKKVLLEDSDLPVVAVQFDWEIKRDPVTNDPVVNPETGKYELIFIDDLLHFDNPVFEENGMRILVLSPYEKITDRTDKIDGICIAGGRDIDPKVYGHDNQGSIVTQPDEDMRFAQCKDWVHNAPKELPVFLICYGYQVYNVLQGGSMVQDISNANEHNFKTREFIPEEGTHLHKVTNGKPIKGVCIHHQAIKEVPECLKPSCYDSEDGSVHGFEWKDDSRSVIGVQWHPEVAPPFQYESDVQLNRDLFKYFGKLCAGYRSKRLSQN